MNRTHGILKVIALLTAPVSSDTQIIGVHNVEQVIRGTFEGVTVNVYPDVLEFMPGLSGHHDCWLDACEGLDLSLNQIMHQHNLSKIRMTTSHLEIVSDRFSPENKLTIHYPEIRPSPVFRAQPTGIPAIDNSSMIVLLNSTTVTRVQKIVSERVSQFPASRTVTSILHTNNIYTCPDNIGGWYTHEPVPSVESTPVFKSRSTHGSIERVLLVSDDEYLDIYPAPSNSRETTGSYTFSYHPRQVGTVTVAATTTQPEASQTEAASAPTVTGLEPVPTGTVPAKDTGTRTTPSEKRVGKKDDSLSWEEQVYRALTDCSYAHELEFLLNEENASGICKGESYLSIAIRHNNAEAVLTLLHYKVDLIGKPVEEQATDQKQQPPFVQFLTVEWCNQDNILKKAGHLIFQQLQMRDQDWTEYTRPYLRELVKVVESHYDAFKKLIKFFHESETRTNLETTATFNPDLVPSKTKTVENSNPTPPPASKKGQQPDSQYLPESPEFYLNLLEDKLEALSSQEKVAIHQFMQSVLSRKARFFNSLFLHKTPCADNEVTHDSWPVTASKPMSMSVAGAAQPASLPSVPATTATKPGEPAKNPWRVLLQQSEIRNSDLLQRIVTLKSKLPGEALLHLEYDEESSFDNLDTESLKLWLKYCLNLVHHIENQLVMRKSHLSSTHNKLHRFMEKSRTEEIQFELIIRENQKKLRKVSNASKNLALSCNDGEKFIIWSIEQCLSEEYSLSAKQMSRLSSHLEKESVSMVDSSSEQATQEPGKEARLSGGLADFECALSLYLAKRATRTAGRMTDKPCLSVSALHNPWESVLPALPENFSRAALNASWQKQAELETVLETCLYFSDEDSSEGGRQLTARESEILQYADDERLLKLLKEKLSTIAKYRKKIVDFRASSIRYESENHLVEEQKSKILAERKETLTKLQRTISAQEENNSILRKEYSAKALPAGRINFFAKSLAEGVYFIVKELKMTQPPERFEKKKRDP